MIEKSIFKDGANKNLTHPRAEKGITLIALVITIIVMLILVGVTISVALNGGLFTTAKEAAEGTASKRNEELELSSGKVEINGEEYNSIDEYVNDSGATGYAAYVVGDEVTVGTENFYVIADSDATQEKVTLLAEYCLFTSSLTQWQGEEDSLYLPEFSTESYWGSGTSPYDIVEPEPTLDEDTGKLTLPASHTAAKAAYDYGRDLGGTGRLMTYSEATALEASNRDILYMGSYWLGSAETPNTLWQVDSNIKKIWARDDWDCSDFRAVRPVVEISKSLIS